jgi:hypothetical protein
MARENITPESIKLNETEPRGFTTAPRVLSHEVAQMREQVTALCDAVLQLVEVQREANQKLEAALQVKTEAAA